MQAEELWKPSKYEIHKGKLRTSRNTRLVNYAERVYVDYEAAAMTKLIPQYCHGTLVDLGCGDVPFFGYYRSFAEKAVTVDWVNSIHQNPFVDVKADLNNPPIPELESDSADCVICSDVLEHIYRPEPLLMEIIRILKKDGVLLLSVPLLFWVHEQPFDYFRYTSFFYEKFFEENGMKILERQNYGGAVDVVSMFASITLLYGLGIFGKPLAWFYSVFPSLVYAIPGLRKKVMASSDLLTLGYTFAVQKI